MVMMDQPAIPLFCTVSAHFKCRMWCDVMWCGVVRVQEVAAAAREYSLLSRAPIVPVSALGESNDRVSNLKHQQKLSHGLLS
jgi:hypothetical protein